MDSITEFKTLPSISILIPDCDDWSTLKVIRCLGEVPKIRIHILSKEKSMLSRFSRFCGHYHYYRSVNDSDWMETIKKLVQQLDIDLILPTTLKGMIFISQNRESLSKLAAIVPLARPEMFAMTNSKWALYEFMNQRNLPGLLIVLNLSRAMRGGNGDMSRRKSGILQMILRIVTHRLFRFYKKTC